MWWRLIVYKGESTIDLSLGDGKDYGWALLYLGLSTLTQANSPFSHLSACKLVAPVMLESREKGVGQEKEFKLRSNL